MEGFADKYGMVSTTETLGNILSMKGARQEMLELATQSYCEENIKFWSAFLLFKESSKKNRIVNAAWIMDNFIVPGSQYEVNIDSKSRKEVMERCKGLSARNASMEIGVEMFDSIAEQVMNSILATGIFEEYEQRVLLRIKENDGLREENARDPNLPRPVGIYGSMGFLPEEIEDLESMREYFDAFGCSPPSSMSNSRAASCKTHRQYCKNPTRT